MSVPVLSVQITVAEPSVSTAASLRMMAPRLAMRCMPRASVMVVIAGSPSGIAATARLTASRRSSCHELSPRYMPHANISALMARHAQSTRLPK